MGPCALILGNITSGEHLHNKKGEYKNKFIPLSLDPPLGMPPKDVNLYQSWNGNYRVR